MSKTVQQKADHKHYILLSVVGKVGVEPTLCLTSRIYSPLSSPTGHTYPYRAIALLLQGVKTAETVRSLNFLCQLQV